MKEWFEATITGVILVALLAGLFWLGGPYDGGDGTWLLECAKHRPLIDCDADLKKLKQRR